MGTVWGNECFGLADRNYNIGRVVVTDWSVLPILSGDLVFCNQRPYEVHIFQHDIIFKSHLAPHRIQNKTYAALVWVKQEKKIYSQIGFFSISRWFIFETGISYEFFFLSFVYDIHMWRNSLGFLVLACMIFAPPHHRMLIDKYHD